MLAGIEVQTPSSAGSLQGSIMGHLVGPSGGSASQQQAYPGVTPQQQSMESVLDLSFSVIQNLGWKITLKEKGVPSRHKTLVEDLSCVIQMFVAIEGRKEVILVFCSGTVSTSQTVTTASRAAARTTTDVVAAIASTRLLAATSPGPTSTRTTTKHQRHGGAQQLVCCCQATRATTAAAVCPSGGGSIGPSGSHLVLVSCRQL